MFAKPVSIRRSVRPSHFPHHLVAIVTFALGVDPLAAQQPVEGLTASAQSLPPAVSQALVTSSGLITFDGMNVQLTPPGQSPRTLLTMSGLAFGSFLVQTSSNRVLFGHTGVGPAGSNDAVWSLPLQGPAPALPLAMVPFNYDATMLAPNTVLLSARLGGFAAASNELLVLDLTTGSTQVVASVPGASGPVAVATNGDIFYATGYAGFPPLPGTAEVLRFPRQQFNAAIASATVLGLADAQLVMSGLDAVSDFAFDDDGDLLFVDWWNGRVSEVSDAAGQPWLAVVIDYGAANVTATALQFVPGTAHGDFEPFQPPNGSLLVHETNYATISQLRSVATAAATLSVAPGTTLGAGPFTLAVAGGPSLGIGVVALAAGISPNTGPLQVPGFEQRLWWNAALTMGPIVVTVAFDAAGQASLTASSPGFSPAVPATLQVAFVAVSGVLGATAAQGILLGP